MKYNSYIIVCFLLLFVFVSCQSAKKSDKKEEPQQQKTSEKLTIDIKDQVKRIKLDNGLTVLLMKRQGAPVFSSIVRVRVGNVEEVSGSTGLAHFFEHMAFKGTEKIGTKDYEKEKILLDKIFKVGSQLVSLKQKGKSVSREMVEGLEKKLADLQKQQEQYFVKDEFIKIFQKNGGSSINAATGNDFTVYTVSLPATKMELWAYLESERWTNLVMRGFFNEVGVVAEERRMRIENSPMGKLYEKFLDVAYDETPYKTVVVGTAEDIQNYTPDKAKGFYEKYYIPARAVVGVVGNFDMQTAEKIVRKYFSRVPAQKDTKTKDYEANYQLKGFPKKAAIIEKDRPRFYLGYHRPSFKSEDDVTFDFIREILCGGRTSRLYKTLVLEKKIANAVSCGATFPGVRLNSVFMFYGMPHAEYSNDHLKQEIVKIVQDLAEHGPTEYEREKILNKLDASLIYSLQSNASLADQLTFFESLTGRWDSLYDQYDKLHQVTSEEIKRVLKKYFVKEREVMVSLENEK